MLTTCVTPRCYCCMQLSLVCIHEFIDCSLCTTQSCFFKFGTTINILILHFTIVSHHPSLAAYLMHFGTAISLSVNILLASVVTNVGMSHSSCWSTSHVRPDVCNKKIAFTHTQVLVVSQRLYKEGVNSTLHMSTVWCRNEEKLI